MSDKDKTPPQITTGSFVEWSGGKGRVDLVVRTGTVPGVSGDPVEATEDSPAARVVVWKDGKPTREKIAASTHTLKRIAPLDGGEEKSDPVARLVALHGQHEAAREEHGLDESASLTGAAIKAAYDRGLADWPGEGATTLSPVDWALGRAAHLSKTALGEVAFDQCNDTDLLHAAHPDAETKDGAPTPSLAATRALVADDRPLLGDAFDLTGGDDPDDPEDAASATSEGEEGEGDTVELTADEIASQMALIDAAVGEPEEG